MLKVELLHDEYVLVTGYADGSDWLFRPTRPPARGVGMAGADHLWTCDAHGRFELFHTSGRRQIATIELGELSRRFPRLPVTVSRDERRLFILQPGDPRASRLTIVDFPAGRVTGVHEDLPGSALRPPLERPDGRLLLAVGDGRLILIDPHSGTLEESSLPGGPSTLGFLDASPDGRYWIRFDPGSLPTRDDTPGVIGRLLGRPPAAERRYGLSVQIWETFPLRFVRRMVVAWLTAKELPDETQLPRMRNRPATLPSRPTLWNMVADAAAATGDAPLNEAPPRSSYPDAVASDQAAWDVIERNVTALAREWIRTAGWQPDGSAVWISTNGFLSCVGLDGTISPRLYTERRGLQGGTVRPIAARFREVVPLAARKARVVYDSGEVLLDGAPSAKPDRIVAVPLNRDGWRERGGPDDREARARSSAFRRIAELKIERRTTVIPVADWSESACIEAIDRLSRLVMAGELHRRVTDGQTRIMFELEAEQLPESKFFAALATRVPGTAPALRRLIEAFADASDKQDFLFANEEGTGVLAEAVRALGVTDLAALPTIKRYGLLVDAEHEHFFAGTTVPAIVRAHGWSDQIIDFVFWVLVRNYYNTLQNYDVIWQAWGLRDAVIRHDPRTLAVHLASELAEIIRWVDNPGRYGTAGLEQLAKQIPQPHEPWARLFFNELERLFPEPAA